MRWLLLLVFVAGCNLTSPPAPDATQQAYLDAVNTARSSARDCGSTPQAKAPALRWNARLAQAALLHTQDLVNNRYLFDSNPHQGSDGSGVDQRIERQGYVWSAVGENIAWGETSLEEAMAGWLGSAGHCANLMSPDFTEMGMARVDNVWDPGLCPTDEPLNL